MSKHPLDRPGPIYLPSLTRRDPSKPGPVFNGSSFATQYATLHIHDGPKGDVCRCGARPARTFDLTPTQARALLVTPPPVYLDGEPIPQPGRCPTCFDSL
jgi:hypothetical protein